MLIKKNNLTKIENENKIRTQIILTAHLKRLIEARRRITGETISEYIRRSALLRLLSEEEEEKELDRLANFLVGSVSLKKHPEWKSKERVKKWVKDLRKDWPTKGK